MKPLAELLRAAGLPPSGEGAVPVGRLICQSDEAQGGDMFVATVGHRHDGHGFVQDAYRRGARVFLCERAVSLPDDAVVIRSENTRKSAAEMLACLYGEPQRRMHITAVTGTKGKTTVLHMLRHILERSGEMCAGVGTTGLWLARERTPLLNTTPDLFVLYPAMARMLAHGCTQLVLEASSQALADGRIDTLPVEVALFTSFGRDHVGEGEHADEAAYLAAKARLFYDFSPRFTAVNADDPAASRMPRGRMGGVKCSLRGRGDMCADAVRLFEGGTEYRFGERTLTLPLYGEPFVMNALLSAAAASYLTGRGPYECLASLSDVRVPGRSEHFACGGRHIVIDYAHNAMSFFSVAGVCRRLYGGRLIAVFGSVSGRSYARREEIAAAADRLFELSVLTCDRAGEEPCREICEHMRRFFSHPENVRFEPSREQAIRLAFSLSRRGDTLLLLGMGDEVHADGHTTDRAVAERLL